MPRKSKVALENLNMDVVKPVENIEEVDVKKITTRTRTRTIKKKEDKPIEDSATKEKKTNPWVEHCKNVKKEYPEMLYRDVLKVAKESYKK